MIEVYRHVLSSLHTAQLLVYVKERTVRLSFHLWNRTQASDFRFQTSLISVKMHSLGSA
jgi:hypothetical protein